MIYVLLPAYNEADDLRELLPELGKVLRLMEQPFTIVLVDDGSTDGTALVGKEVGGDLPLVVLVHQRNQGLGQAIKTGFTHVIDEGDLSDILVTMDADNSHPPELIPKLVDVLKDGADVAVASRFVPGAVEIGLSLKRKLLSRGASLVLRTLFPYRGIRDYSSGYRAYRLEGVKQAVALYGEKLIESSGFPVMTEIILKMGHLGLNIREFPLQLCYHLKQGRSKLKVLRTIFGYMRMMLRVRFQIRQVEVHPPQSLINNKIEASVSINRPFEQD